MKTRAEFDEVKYAAVLGQWQPRPIRTEDDNRRAIAILEGLDANNELTPEQEALAEIFTTVIEKFEEERYGLGSTWKNARSARSVVVRQGYTMPAKRPSRGPVSERPGSALPPKAATVDVIRVDRRRRS